MKAFASKDVERKFDGYPPGARQQLLDLRALILDTAARTPGVGEIEEALKWGEPAYLTSRTKSGSTVRIDWKPGNPDCIAVYFHCQTNLVETFRSLFPHDFGFEGNRALLLPVGAPLPEDALAFCVAASLTYHLRKHQARRAG